MMNADTVNRPSLVYPICLLTVLLVASPALPLAAQVTADRYARAEEFLGPNARRLVYGTEVSPNWISGNDRFWYRNHISTGHEFVMVDASARTRRSLFDHARLAASLSVAADTTFEGFKLPFETFRFSQDRTSIEFLINDSTQWACNINSYECSGPSPSTVTPVDEVVSPDGRWIAFVRDENLWIRSADSGQERQLSRDGEAHYGYGVHPENRDEVIHRRTSRKRRPILAWSPDSRKIVTHRMDERKVNEVYHLETAVGRAILYRSRYALPGDSIIPTYDLYVFDVAGGRGVRLDVPPQEMVNTTCCGMMQDSIWKDVQWSGDSRQIFFTNLKRGYKEIDFYAADPATGDVRLLLREGSRTFIELNVISGTAPNWRVTSNGSEFIWFSQRDGWGHLYLYDGESGTLKNQITAGPWVVHNIVHLDEANRRLYFTAVGRDAGRDPYFRRLYRVALDGSGMRLLTSEDADHAVVPSPSGRYFVDTYSTRKSVPVTVVRDTDGRAVQEVQRGDVSRLLEAGWRWPTPFTVKARDGVTDISGFLYFPSDFDPARSYPIIDYIYPGPQGGPIGFRSFTPAPRGEVQALAEVGFIVFTIDAMGTPGRSKAFHDAYYARLEDNGIPDHITAMRQLARVYPQIDLDRVGIYGHSGGGFSSTGAILTYPDFFKVAVSGAGNHDNRSFGFYWGEKYHGLLTPESDGSDNYDSQANHLSAQNLKGKLLLSYGTLDDRVHPNATLLLIDKLIEHNKDFDLIVMPNRNHGYSGEAYITRRTWDYFVRHLLHVDPPREYRLGS